MDMNIAQFRLEITSNGELQTHFLETMPAMAIHKFQGLIIQAARSPGPCKIRIAMENEFWSELDQKFKPRETALEFRNNAYGDRE